jgi:hypothetical protein
VYFRPIRVKVGGVLIDLLKMFWKKHAAAVKEFREKKCSQYCPICGDNCCNGRLNPSFTDSRPFAHLKKIRYRWHKPPSGEPFIVDRKFLFFGSYFLVNECPYLARGLCTIHGDAKRPFECHEYPMYLGAPFGVPFFKPFISAESSCSIFKYEKNIAEARALAGELGLDIIFHSDPGEAGDQL